MEQEPVNGYNSESPGRSPRPDTADGGVKAKNPLYNDNFIDDSNSSCFAGIIELIHSRMGADFSCYKPDTIVRRLQRRLYINKLNRLDDYYSLLMKSPPEAEALFKELLIGVTSFFRENEAFEALRLKVLPGLLQGKKAGDIVRVWSVGCSTGEEAYSLAILCEEYLEHYTMDLELKVFATDIDRDSLAFAQKGAYPPGIVSALSADRLAKYFLKTESGYKVAALIREKVDFGYLDILKSGYLPNNDLVCCRNLLIYLNTATQNAVLKGLRNSLVAGGCLFLGTSESLGDVSENFKLVDSRYKLFRSA